MMTCLCSSLSPTTPCKCFPLMSCSLQPPMSRIKIVQPHIRLLRSLMLYNDFGCLFGEPHVEVFENRLV